MADYGLKIFDASGNTTLDTTDRITRLRYSIVVSGGISSSIVLSDISGKLSVECSINLEPESTKCAHLVSRSGTTITWTAQSGTYFTSANSLILVFLYT